MTDNKLIICTTALIRGDLQRQSMGKFYKEFNQYLQNYEIYHIINIDQPNNLKKYFSIY